MRENHTSDRNLGIISSHSGFLSKAIIPLHIVENRDLKTRSSSGERACRPTSRISTFRLWAREDWRALRRFCCAISSFEVNIAQGGGGLVRGVKKGLNMRLLNLFSTGSFRNDGAMKGVMLPRLLLVLNSGGRSHERASIIPSHTADTSGELLSTSSQLHHFSASLC